MQRVTKTGSEKNRSYRCEKCGRSFSSSSNLNRHLVLHTGNFRWYCDICQKGYNQKDNYEKHIRAHRGLKYKCEYCGKDFAARSRLKYHMSEHTGEYKFVCDKCDEGFNLKPAFEKHMEQLVIKVFETWVVFFLSCIVNLTLLYLLIKGNLHEVESCVFCYLVK